MKKALVLAGGGAKGAYEAGFIKAIHESKKMDFQIVTGTSIGALNACLLAQKDIDVLLHLWENMNEKDVFTGGLPDFNGDFEHMLDQSHLAVSFFKNYVKEKGADIAPLKHLIRNLLDEDVLLHSSIDFGLCTVRFPSLEPLYITKEEMPRQYIYDYLLASASCFPFFPIHHFNNQSFIDGGYYDNVPIDLAFDMGAKEVLVIDLTYPVKHPHYLHLPNVQYTYPQAELNGFMDFSKSSLERSMRLGYLQGQKTTGQYVGNRYTFLPFETSLFEIVYQKTLDVERKIRQYAKSSSKDHLHQQLMETHFQEPLLQHDYLYVLMDWLCDLLERDISYVYNFDLVVDDILEDFAEYLNRDFSGILHGDLHILEHLHNRGIVGIILHLLLYPEHDKMGVERLMNFFDKQYMMAQFIKILYQKKQSLL